MADTVSSAGGLGYPGGGVRLSHGCIACHTHMNLQPAAKQLCETYNAYNTYNTVHKHGTMERRIALQVKDCSASSFPIRQASDRRIQRSRRPSVPIEASQSTIHYLGRLEKLSVDRVERTPLPFLQPVLFLLSCDCIDLCVSSGARSGSSVLCSGLSSASSRFSGVSSRAAYA